VIGEPQPLAMAHLRDLTRLDIRCARCKGHGAALDNAFGLTLVRRRAGRIATGQRQDRGGRSAPWRGTPAGHAGWPLHEDRARVVIVSLVRLCKPLSVSEM
jgi:hypothetical protein